MARTDFDYISEIRERQPIARGPGVQIRKYLNQTYGRRKWRKMKGFATIQYSDGRIVDAEIHWFEAHGYGRVLEKAIKDIT